MQYFKSFVLFLAGAFALCGTSAHAQERYTVQVGTISSTQSCAYFRNYSGSRLSYSESEYARYWGAAAARRYYAAHTTWRSWVVKDCQDNFKTLRSSIEAALASTGRITVGRGGYVVDVTISDVSADLPATNRPVRGDASYRTSWGKAVVTANFTVRDRTGASVDGGIMTKRIEMSRTLDTNRMRVRVSEPGGAVYDLIQNEVALQIAREVTFGIEPVQVIGVDGDRVEINYGRPLVSVGDQIDVSQLRGIGAVRFRVISAGDRTAVAQVRGDVDFSDVDIGSTVSFIEADSDAANARVLRRNRLP